MEQRDNEEHEEQNRSDTPPQGELASRNGGPAPGRLTIGTDSPAIASGPGSRADWLSHPDGTIVIETGRIREPNEAFNPGFVMVPVESKPPPRDHPETGNGNGNEKKNGNENKEENRGKSQTRQKGAGNKDQSNPKQDRKEDEHASGSHPKDKPGQSSQAPSLTRILLFSGIVALVCGVAGAWAYSSFFGSSRSGGQKSSSKDSRSSKDPSSSNDSDSGGDSDASKSSSSSKEDSNIGDLRQAEAAWMTAIKELHQGQEAEKAARRSEEETKAVLDFFKKTLLSAGRPGDVSLTEAFWAGGQAKDVTLRKAVDLTESRAAEAFAERPLAEASVRETLGLAYLSLGDPARGLQQYERAFALRQAMQGANDPDMAACRNQLAVAYRLAGRASEGARLFDSTPDSPAHASALAIRGEMLLLEQKPADAELPLRECLSLRLKMQPEDWTTFDTKSTLGEALLDQKEFADAEPMLLSGYEGMKQRQDTIPPQDKPRLTKAVERVVKLYEVWGKTDKAMTWRKELERSKSRTNL